jgi:hypothetical protein
MHKRKPGRLPEIEYNPVCEPERMHGYKSVRWVEHASRGLRLVGFADKIVRIDHKGWYTHEDGDPDETYRGVVYQMPARDRKERFAYGYADPNNDDCALLSFELDADTKEEAARYADRFAEIFAEEARDYDRAWQAGRRYETLGEEVSELRTEALAIGEEMRAAKRANVAAPTICARLRADVLSLYRRIQKARKERAELLDNFGREPGWQE